MTAFTNNSRFLIGTESVTYQATDSASSVAFANALFAELGFRESMRFGSIDVESQLIAIELDAAGAATPGTVPARGGRIARGDSTNWRIMSVTFDHVIGVYRCVCSLIR